MQYNRVTNGLSDINRAIQRLVRAEFRLLQAEIKDASGRVGGDIRSAVMFTAIAMLGILPFLAFVVIGLGRILNDNYWLSALIVSVLCFGVGGTLAYRAFSRITAEDMSLPRSRRSLDRILTRTRGSIARARPSGVKIVREVPLNEVITPSPEKAAKDESHRRAA